MIFKIYRNLATKESCFTFNSNFYIQVDGVAMGSPIGPILANVFLSHHEENWLNKTVGYPKRFKPRFYKRYVDDIFVLFESSESAYSFRKYMPSKHQTLHKLHHRKGKCWLTFVFRRQKLS